MRESTTMAMGGRLTMSLMNFPAEILYMIVGFATTPLDDVTPLDQKTTSAIKELSLVNKTFREICIKVTFCRIRMWKKEDNLAGHLADMYQNGKSLLRLST
jgi:hypothetical protein